MINHDYYKLSEIRDLVNELDMLKGDCPHAFELCISTAVLTSIRDGLRGEVNRVSDEARQNGEKSA